MNFQKFDPLTIELVKERLDIEQVIGSRIELKKSGSKFKACCPFHDDRSPSLVVDPNKKFFHCFGCGVGGDAIKFIQLLDKCSFSQALEGIAQSYGISIQSITPEQRAENERAKSERDLLLEVTASAERWFADQLRRPVGTQALDYLRSRLSDAAIQDWSLGYAPRSGLTSYLLARYPSEAIALAGLSVTTQDGEMRDRFRDRAIVPIRDAAGRVVGFGARTMSGAEPKYLNSPESPVFRKEELLFGLDRARSAIQKSDAVNVVEGYFDVMALHDQGITNTVAAMGTALNGDRVRQLAKLTESKRVILNFDGDDAGRKAAHRAIVSVQQAAAQGEIQLRVLTLPTSKDADEFVRRQGADAYRQLADHAPLWVDWQIAEAIALETARGDWQRAIRVAVDILRSVETPAMLSGYIKRCAERLARGDANRALQLERDLRSQLQSAPKRQHRQKTAAQSTEVLLEQQILWLYQHDPAARPDIDRIYPEFVMPTHRQLWRSVRLGEPTDLGFEAAADRSAIGQFAALQRHRLRRAAMVTWAKEWAKADEGCPNLQALTDLTVEILLNTGR